jgi:hypothetical protein
VGDTPTFHVVVIYDESASGRRAKHFYDRAIQELADECDFSFELWSFEVLALPKIGNSVARDAAEADFVILSMHGSAQLSVQTRDWLEKWLKLITDHKPALIALLDRRETRRGTAASTLAYLRKIADRHEISFYAHAYFALSSS